MYHGKFNVLHGSFLLLSFYFSMSSCVPNTAELTIHNVMFSMSIKLLMNICTTILKPEKLFLALELKTMQAVECHLFFHIM